MESLVINKIEKFTENAQLREALKGRRGHCWDILQNIYHAFLIALEYQPTGWREEGKI